MKWTNEQYEAITHRNSNLLVSAAAGSGKTAVLVERIMGLLCDGESPVDADRLLVVTFTNAAAAEMRQKIETALRKRIAENPENTHLRRQRMLLQRAQISTVHAFCQNLLRRYFYACDIDPSFTVVEATDGELLRKSVLAELLEERMDKPTAALRRLAATVCTRGDQPLHDMVLTLHQFFSSLPFFESRLETFSAELSACKSFEETIWGQYLFSLAKERLSEAQVCNELALSVARATEGLEKYQALLITDAAVLAELDELAGRGWDALLNGLDMVKWTTLPACKVPEREAVKKDRERMKSAVKATGKILAKPVAELKEELSAIAPVVAELCRLVCDLNERFRTAKKERAVLDFADLEHYTLALLYEQEGVESPVAEEVRSLFDAVLVDEYQDTNDTQELIFKAVSNGKNLFTVGDVKQSIYGFRGAVPQLFMARAARYETGEEAGKRIDLNRNFRSRSTVLKGINQIFERLMTSASSELVYDHREALVFGQTSYDIAADKKCRLCLYETVSGRKADNLPLEAGWIADEILRMVTAKQPVCENGVNRPIRYADIAVLFRSDSGTGAALLDAFKAKGIPAVSERGDSFFDRPEVQTMISLLEIIDNPLQDIPLVAVLRSPIAGFDEDRLLRLRGTYGKGSVYALLKSAAKDGDKAAYAFLKRLSDWRERAAQEPLGRFVQELLYETDLDLYYGVQPDGASRSARLHALTELAVSFETNNYHGLSAFVRRLNAMAEKKQNPVAGPTPESDNAVRLLTIHKSKGLEFPVVFLCRADSSLKHKDMAKCVYHKTYGIGVEAMDPRLRIRYPTAVSDVILRAQLSESVNEELRVLYVALTRAKEELIVTGAFKSPDKLEEKLFPTLITHAFLTENFNYLDWMLAVLAVAPNRPEKIWGAYGCWELAQIKAPATGVVVTDEEAQKEQVLPPPSQETAAILSYRYPYEDAAKRPVKMTVTQLKRAAEEGDGILLHPRRVYDLERPKFLQEQKLSGAEEGDLMHRCFEHLKLDTTAVGEQLTNLTDGGWLSADEAAQVDLKMLEQFLSSTLFGRMQKADALWREQSFETQLETALGTMLVQGIVDCYFEEEDGLIVVDYKTDRVKTADELAERYRVQLDSYAEALSKLTQKPVKEKIIWAARLGEAITV